jgi:two-component system cell cycle sensor histidine kinase/response regulator CckA
MKIPSDSLADLGALRRLAEERFAHEGHLLSGRLEAGSVEFELGVREVELAMQNEALREANEELHRSRNQYRELYDLAPVPYLTLSSRGVITDANAAAARILGAAVPDLRDAALASFLLPEHADRFELHRREILNEGAVASADVTIRSRDGRTHEVRFESICTDPRGQEWRTTIIDRSDVTELKRYLMQAERDSALGILTTGIAHDFNNLLQAVLGGAQIALHRIHGGADAKRSLELIRRAAWRGRSVVRQLHAFATGDHEGVGVADVNEVVSSWAPLAQGLLGEDIELRLDLAAPLSRVPMDAGHVEQVLLNLAKNARHAMPQGGILGVSTTNVAGQGARKVLCLCVSDNGRGMDAETRARAMEAFFTTKARGGSGLGLAMVRAVVEWAGGHVTLSSSVGRGTSVCLELPLSEDEVVTQPSEFPVADIDFSPLGLRVLVVEDAPLTRRAIRDYLEEMDCEVMAVTTGKEALEMLAAHSGQIRLLVTDIVLPDIGGPLLAKTAREREPLLATLLTSAHTMETLVERGWVQAEAARVLQKPFTAEAFASAIRGVLRTAPTIPPPSVPRI